MLTLSPSLEPAFPQAGASENFYCNTSKSSHVSNASRDDGHLTNTGLLVVHHTELYDIAKSILDTETGTTLKAM
jgi:hypothetical protein